MADIIAAATVATATGTDTTGTVTVDTDTDTADGAMAASVPGSFSPLRSDTAHIRITMTAAHV